MTRTLLLPLVPFTLLLALALPAAGQDTDTLGLRPQWEPGQTALYEFWNRRNQKTTMSFGGRSREAAVLFTSEGQTRWTVDKVNDDGSAECTMTLEWITATVEAAGQKQEVDSRKGTGENERMHKLIRAMAKTPLKVTVNADGSIEGVKGVDKIKQKIGKDLEALVPEALDFAETASDLATLTFAPQAPAVGDSYKAEHRWTHDMGHTDQAWTYTVASVADMEGVPVATITGKAKVSLDVDQSEIPADAPPVDIKMVKGEATTQVFYDLSRREAVGRHSTEDHTVKIVMTLPQGRGKMERTIEQSIQGQVLRVSEE